MGRPCELSGLDGANPLGFLAALGTLVCLHEAGVGDPRLSWKAAPYWVPLLDGVGAKDERELSQLVAESLRGAAVTPDAEARRKKAEREMDQARKALEHKQQEIRRRGLRGSQRSEAIERELRPLEHDYQQKRQLWLEALKESVPRPELALGKRIDCTAEEYRTHAAALADGSGLTTREPLDLLAAFGSDACQANSGAIEPTPFSFTAGSGRQYFLETAQKLVACVAADHVSRVLFRPWDYRDEGLSMRWDPSEDRRYALMDRDPTASGNEPRTMWMANLLAYRALALFSSAPAGRRLTTAGWDSDRRYFTWPIWEHPLGADTVRSLVQLRELVEERPDQALLGARGVAAVYRSSRLQVGQGVNRKLNFSPARQVAGVHAYETTGHERSGSRQTQEPPSREVEWTH